MAADSSVKWEMSQKSAVTSVSRASSSRGSPSMIRPIVLGGKKRRRALRTTAWLSIWAYREAFSRATAAWLAKAERKSRSSWWKLARADRLST